MLWCAKMKLRTRGRVSLRLNEYLRPRRGAVASDRRRCGRKCLRSHYVGPTFHVPRPTFTDRRIVAVALRSRWSWARPRSSWHLAGRFLGLAPYLSVMSVLRGTG